uniref:Uncharacterized protein n=1 Tax=Cannabis sativa TaxID=3483 RepID=A0A803PRL5_CANSA
MVTRPSRIDGHSTMLASRSLDHVKIKVTRPCAKLAHPLAMQHESHLAMGVQITRPSDKLAHPLAIQHESHSTIGVQTCTSLGHATGKSLDPKSVVTRSCEKLAHPLAMHHEVTRPWVSMMVTRPCDKLTNPLAMQHESHLAMGVKVTRPCDKLAHPSTMYDCKDKTCIQRTWCVCKGSTTTPPAIYDARDVMDVAMSIGTTDVPQFAALHGNEKLNSYHFLTFHCYKMLRCSDRLLGVEIHVDKTQLITSKRETPTPMVEEVGQNRQVPQTRGDGDHHEEKPENMHQYGLTASITPIGENSLQRLKVSPRFNAKVTKVGKMFKDELKFSIATAVHPGSRVWGNMLKREFVGIEDFYERAGKFIRV